MAEEPEQASGAAENEVRETDIVFDCPYCTKSLAIDYHGAGLTIKCSDCGNDVVVPIPEGLELDDLDSSREDQEMRIVNLRRSLAVAEGRVAELETRLAELQTGRETSTQLQARFEERARLIQDRLRAIQTAQDDISRAMRVIAEALQNL